MRKKLLNNKGVTLVTLVVTIIVLIILAGVSINMLLGENGIITKAKEAAKLQEIAYLKEEIGLKILEQELETEEKITQEKIETIFSNYGTVNKNEDGTIKSLTPTGKDYEIAYEEIYTGTTVEEGDNGGNTGDGTNNGSDTVTLTREEYNSIIERLDAIDGGTKTSISITDVALNMSSMQDNVSSSINDMNNNINNINSNLENKTYNTLFSNNKNYSFVLQDDGNAVIYTSSGVNWSSFGSNTSIYDLQNQVNALSVSGNFGTHVNIAGYTETSYTCPSDGYIKALPNGDVGNYIDVYINDVQVAINRCLTYASPTCTPIYVRKGMRVRVTYNANPTAAVFIPIL